MKIQCDVCGVEQAAVLCCADEAVLCWGCDGRIHSANKLAGKHRRLSLFLPSPLPLCDNCKEKTGLVFCQEDRAILCRDCDAPIHTATAQSARHNRFLLSGIRLSEEADTPRGSRVQEEKHGTESSISDYLMNMLPGWRVDDFLFDDPSPYKDQPIAVNSALDVAAPPEMHWSSFEEASMVPELSQFDYNCRINKRARTSVFF